MTVLSKLVGGQRTVQATTWGAWPGDGLSTWSGTTVDTTSALQLLTVYGCNRFICDGISTLPVDALRDTPKGIVEVAKPPWLTQPTIDLDFTAWSTQVLTSLLLDGNAYCWIRRSATAEIQELVPLNPAKVKVTREQGARTYRIDGNPIDSYDLLHIPGVMFPGAETGLSPVEAARQTIGKASSTEEFAARFFGQGLNMSGVIETPGELTDEQSKAMANTFARRHTGKNKAHLPAVLPNGAKWTATGVTNEQAQFLGTQQFTAAQICSFLFLIDPTEFGVSMDKGSSVTYANLEQRNARKVQVTFLPWIIRIEQALSNLIRQSNRYVKFNVNGLLRGDLKTRYESYQIGIGSGFLTIDEARELEELSPLPEPTPAVPPVSEPADAGLALVKELA